MKTAGLYNGVIDCFYSSIRGKKKNVFQVKWFDVLYSWCVWTVWTLNIGVVEATSGRRSDESASPGSTPAGLNPAVHPHISLQ